MTMTDGVATPVKAAVTPSSTSMSKAGLLTDPLDSAGLVPVGPPSVAAGTTVLTVGVGKQFATLAAAVAAAPNGSVILVNAGTYTNDFAIVTTKISIIGVGGMVNLVATVPPPDLKGILTVDNDVTIKNLSFSGCTIPDADGGNGAGIRYEGGQMVLVNDSFTGNQDGILAAPVLPQLTANTISIDHSVFSGNGSGSGYTHNLYVGDVTSLTATNSVFEGAIVGHEFKSRALSNDIEGNVFRDGPTGTASYDIDLPDGGADLIRDNVIEKGPDSENQAMIHFGGEGIPYAGSSLLVENNQLVNDRGSSTVAVLNQTAISVTIDDNVFQSIAAGQIVQGPATGTGNTNAAGTPLPNINAIGVLPGNTIIFTDNAPHTVVLTGSVTAVEGGGGLLTVSAIAGHVVAIGGSGGMVFTEGAASGGNSITTQAGSVNSITVVGQDLIDSLGTDRIIGGAGNLTGAIGGTATIDDGTGNDQWAVTGTASITGHGGNPAVTVGPQGRLTVTGALGYLSVQDNGGNAQFDVTEGGAEEQASITGGGVDATVNAGATSISTAAGAQGTTLQLGAGRVQVTSLGADTIWAGSGAATIIVAGAAVVHAGTGALSFYGRSDTQGASFYGNGGTYLLSGDTGNITYYGGALASALEDDLSNDTLVGGAGRLTIDGGSRETITGGSGGIVYSATDGGGANVIHTAAGAQDVLNLAAADVVVSAGNDIIHGGTGNQIMTVLGNSSMTGSTGNSVLTFGGTDMLTGRGQDWCTVEAGAMLTVTAGSLTSVTEAAATVRMTIASGAHAAAAAVTGGAATLIGGSNTGLAITTTAGAATQIQLGAGTIAATLNGADRLQGGTGLDTVTLNAANTTLVGGTGQLIVQNNDLAAGDRQTLYAHGANITYSQGAGALQFIGGSGTAVITGGGGSLNVFGGTGALTILGGSAGLNFTAGSGTASIAMTAGGGNVTFGAGQTTVQDAGIGADERFHAVSGRGGGTDSISGFRIGTDQLLLQGVTVASEQLAGGSTNLLLSDHTQVTLVGVSDTGHVLG